MKHKLITPKPEHLWIIEKVLGYYETTYTELIKKNGKSNRDETKQRYMVMYFLKKETALTLAEIGSLFGKDHATVRHGVELIESDIKTYVTTRIEVNQISGLLSTDRICSTWNLIKLLTGFDQIPDKKVTGYTWDDISDFMEAYARIQTPKQVLMHFAEYLSGEFSIEYMDENLENRVINFEIAEEMIDNYIKEVK